MRNRKELKVWWYARAAIAMVLAWASVVWLAACAVATGSSEDVGRSKLALGEVLMIAPENKSKLENGCWTKEEGKENSYLLNWENCADGRFGGRSFDAPYKSSKKVGAIVGTTFADNHNGYRGECVSMVKALAHDDTVTAGWQQGENVVESNDVIPGTAIATFGPGGKYNSRHAAFFAGYERDSSGQVTGIWVWDENWSRDRDGAVRFHLIRVDSGSIRARDFFVVHR